MLWISQPFVLGRIYPGLSALWITHAVDYARWRMLWISQHFALGRIYPGFALWITGLSALWITLAGLAVD